MSAKLIQPIASCWINFTLSSIEQSLALSQDLTKDLVELYIAIDASNNAFLIAYFDPFEYLHDGNILNIIKVGSDFCDIDQSKYLGQVNTAILT